MVPGLAISPRLMRRAHSDGIAREHARGSAALACGRPEARDDDDDDDDDGSDLDTIDETADPADSRALPRGPSVPRLNLAPVQRERDAETRQRAGIFAVLSSSGLAVEAGGDHLVFTGDGHDTGRSGLGRGAASSVPAQLSRRVDSDVRLAARLEEAASSPRSSAYGGDAMQWGVGLQGWL